MKRIILILALAVFAAGAAGAQETPQKPSFKGFVSNGFWDNWELSIGAGPNYVGWDGLGFSGQASRRDNIGWALEGTATKWFTPVIGVRAQLIGGRLYMSDGRGGKYDSSYILPHVDGIANLSNWISGYREDRLFNVKVLAGFGANFTAVRADEAGKSFVFDAGVLGSFRVCNAVDINIEGKLFLTPSKDMPYPVSQVGGKYTQIYSLTVGATYRFNKRDFQRGAVGYTTDQIVALQKTAADTAAALENSKSENTRLANELNAAGAATKAAKAQAEAEARRAAAAEAAAKNAADSQTSLILYDLGKSTLSSKELTRLNVLVDKIKNGPKDRVYSIDGYADPQTGTAAINQRLSERRAKAVYDYLVKKGVNPDQLTYQGKGDQNVPYPEVQKANRAAIVK